MKVLLFTVLLKCAPLFTAKPTYTSYGKDVTKTAQVHKQAVLDFIDIVKATVDVEFAEFPVIVYDPTTMTDDDIANATKFACDNYKVCASAQQVRDGEFCGGVCGNPSIMVYKHDSGHSVAFIQEEAVHETLHILQMQNGAPRYVNTEGGDESEVWLNNGPRWWGEGTAMWMGDRLLRAYPTKYSKPDPTRQNMCRTYSQACSSYKNVSTSRKLRLTNAIQASDEPWKKVHEVYDGELCGSVEKKSAYYEMVYEGGYCALEYMLALDGLDTQKDADMKTAIRTVMNATVRAKTENSWETAFLNAFKSHFASMKDFYEKFEKAKGAAGYVYVAPITPSQYEATKAPTPTPAASADLISSDVGKLSLMIAVCATVGLLQW
eukprot:TRINITY_DN46986_c0_g1_i1.p1 TRINITY_DN46986_c0_g1~~TRINITY_DN46986_c0_g1_i1.p1  ORF type:complete len:378 (-),score=52.27 TRINITY_DN46986_c0_g1_i1:134-1267(-)